MKLQPAPKAILDELQKTSDELFVILKKSLTIDKQLNELTGKFKSLSAAYELITGEKPPVDRKLFANLLENNPVSGVNAKIGDALEAILKEHKALETSKAITLLRERRVKLSLKNPRNVLANVVKRDKENRFTRLEDGRISLREK